MLYKRFNAVPCTTVFCLDEDVAHDNKNMNGVLSQMFWLVFNGDGHAQRIQYKSALNGVQDFSKEFAHPVGLSFWAMYQGIICILHINILIAMMNNKFIKIWQNVDAEWKFSTSGLQACKKLSQAWNFALERTPQFAGAVLGPKSYYARRLQMVLLLCQDYEVHLLLMSFVFVFFYDFHLL